jgi:signal recognition particle subunit SRP54
MITSFLAKRFLKSFEKYSKAKTLTDEQINNFCQDVKDYLFEASIDPKLIDFYINEINFKIKSANLDNKISDNLIKICKDELIKILGKEKLELIKNPKLNVYMLVGIQGSGKTTTIAKIAKFLKTKNSENEKILLVSADVYRPAAYQQLKILAENNQLQIFQSNEKLPLKIIQDAHKYAQKNDYNFLIIDSAGRLDIDDQLMNELINIKENVNIDETLLVVDAMSGRTVIETASIFQKKVKITGLIITKFDGTAQAGAALSINFLNKIPIKFLGTGEKIDDFEIFYPERIASRMLGQGDLETIADKIKTNKLDSDKDINEAFSSGKFDLNTMLIFLKKSKKLGPLSKVIELIPWVSSKIKSSQITGSEEKLKIYEVLINSMHKKERKEPNLVRYPTRKIRILKGAGGGKESTKKEKEFNQLLEIMFNNLLNDYQRISKMMKHIIENKESLKNNPIFSKFFN